MMIQGSLQVVGIAELKFSRRGETDLITHSLGSCVGVTAYDPALGIGGMVHCLLPLSQADPQLASQQPGRFVDTGVSALLQNLFNQGAKRDRLAIKVAGGAAMQGTSDLFRIGERNITVVRKIFWKNQILIGGQDVGGSCPRTMILELETGRTLIKSGGQEKEL